MKPQKMTSFSIQAFSKCVCHGVFAFCFSLGYNTCGQKGSKALANFMRTNRMLKKLKYVRRVATQRNAGKRVTKTSMRVKYYHKKLMAQIRKIIFH